MTYGPTALVLPSQVPQRETLLPAAPPTQTSKLPSHSAYCTPSARLWTATSPMRVPAGTRADIQAFVCIRLAVKERVSPSIACAAGYLELNVLLSCASLSLTAASVDIGGAGDAVKGNGDSEGVGGGGGETVGGGGSDDDEGGGGEGGGDGGDGEAPSTLVLVDGAMVTASTATPRLDDSRVVEVVDNVR